MTRIDILLGVDSLRHYARMEEMSDDPFASTMSVKAWRMAGEAMSALKALNAADGLLAGVPSAEPDSSRTDRDMERHAGSITGVTT